MAAETSKEKAGGVGGDLRGSGASSFCFNSLPLGGQRCVKGGQLKPGVQEAGPLS